MIIGLFKDLKLKEADDLSSEPLHECGICCESIEKDDLTTLSCADNHCGSPHYHYDCIVKWWLNIHKSTYLQKKTYVIRQCPYCRVTADKITSKDKTNKLYEKIHSNYVLKESDLVKWRCQAITKSSKKQCTNCKNPNYGNYCGIHKKFFIQV